MSATRLDLAWNTQNAAWSLAVGTRSRDESGLVRQIAPARGLQRCPGCRSIIYSRRHRLCSVCAEPLPETLLFSDREAERVEELLQRERQLHRKWMGRR